MGFLGFIVTSIIGMFLIAGIFVLIDVTNQYVPEDAHAQDAASATLQPTEAFRPAVQINDLWYFAVGFAVLLVLAFGYKMYTLTRGQDDEPG